MFKSKKDVDAHVRDVFSKCKSENERLKLCYGIAKQYCGIREFDSARRYLETYLNSDPTNLAESNKLMGDIHLELGDNEKALESYKISYTEGKARDSLNRVCDLLARGFGSKETAESKKAWFDMQKSSMNNNPLSSASSSGSSPVVPRRTPINLAGPPKTGFSQSTFTNGSPGPLVSSASKINGNGVDLQLRYLERRFDDGLGKILDQNTLILEQMLKLKDEVKKLSEKVEDLSAQNGEMQSEIRDLRAKQEETHTLALENKQNPSNQDSVSCATCQTARPAYETTIKPVDLPASLPTFNFGFPTANTSVTTPNLSFSINNTQSFGTTPVSQLQKPQQSMPETVVDSVTHKKTDESKDTPFIGLNQTGQFSFADLAKTNNTSTFSFGIGTGSTGTTGFSGAGAPLFNATSSPNSNTTSSKANTSANHDETEDDFVPTAEFQPVIPLPPLVEVKKGDENENTIAEYRAKLYRFVNETKEWKERGVGNVKLLQSKDDERKCRVVMWREKIGKLACNFNLFPDIKVTNYQNNPKVLCWKCQDSAEDISWETFTLRFGSEDNCKHFKEEMERLAKLTVTSTGETPPRKGIDMPQAPKIESSQVPLSQLVKKPEGSWNCDACYSQNNKDSVSCAACQTARPGFESSVKPADPPATLPKFSFGFPTANTSATTPNLSFSINNTQTFGTAPVSEQQKPQQNVPANVVDSVTPKKSDESKDTPFVGLNLSGKFSFADLAKTNSTPNFSFGIGAGSTGTTGFSGAGTPLFNATSSPNSNTTSSKANTSGNHDETEDDFVPTAEFQPVIPLPPLVEVKKGDENENTIAEYRAKLYRFVTESKEWKERGVGNIKLLQSKDDERKCRVVMWREKIGKLACNFNLFPDIKVTNYQNNPKVLCWKCQDSAEDISWETFTLRFGNEDNCKHFKEEMERLAKLTVASTGETPSRQEKNKAQAPDTESSQVPLSQLVKKPEGSWNCDACYSQNNKDSVSCAACQTARPGYEAKTKPEDPPASLPTFNFGFPTANTSTTTPNLSFSINNTQTFGTAPVTQQQKPQQSVPASVVESVTPKKTDENKDTPFVGLNLSGKFSFADLAKTNSTPTFSFGIGTGSTGTTGFSGAGTPLFNSTTTSNSSNANTSANADDAEDDFVPTAEFQPVIPLPPLVEVKKGDENENTIAEYRAKLYRFVNETKEWKERGVGNVKLLQSKEDDRKCRVVMWREKIGKLACNFSLFPNFTVTNYQNNPKVLCWKCQDYAEEPSSWETFTLRFGNEDNCKHFKEEMERLAKLTVVSTGETPPRQGTEKTQAPKTESSQVPLSQLIQKPEGSWNCNECYSQNNKDSVSCAACQAARPGFESSVKPADLPATLPKFSFGFPTANAVTSVNADEKPSCSGCIGCNPEDFKMPETKEVDVKEKVIELPLALDSASDPCTPVTLSLFTSSSTSSKKTSQASQGSDSSVSTESKTATNATFPNFSFSMQTPEKANPISFPFKNSSFSFKSPDGNNTSIFGGGSGSIFSSPTGGNAVSGTPSPFVSPFAQPASLNNSTSCPTQPPTFSFSQNLFTQQSPAEASNNEEVYEQREDEEYEDVEDEEEEDECMFEDDVRVYIKDDLSSPGDFSDKGEATVRVLYDGESYCARLVILNDGETIAEHLVAAETLLESTDALTYEWIGICNDDAPKKSRIKAVFSNEDSFKSFYSVMADSLEFAVQSGITEEELLDQNSGGY